MPDQHLEQFNRSLSFSHEGKEFPYWQSKHPGLPVVLLHELVGLSPACIEVGAQLTDQGFAVSMPHFFGKANPGPLAKQMNMIRGMTSGFLGCVRREMENFRNQADTPVTNWLRAFVRHIEPNPDGKVGLIGMCMTGNFALLLIAESNIQATVTCQPYFKIGIQKEDEPVRIAQQKGPRCMIGFRYQEDSLSQKLETVEELYGDAFEAQPRFPGKGHSTLTAQAPEHQQVRQEAIATTVAFLKERLA